MKLWRCSKLILVTVVAAILTSVMSMSTAQADSLLVLTTLDNYTLKQGGQPDHRTGPMPGYSWPQTNQDAMNYCVRVGFGNGWGQCHIQSFYEESRQYDVNYARLAVNGTNGAYWNCTPNPGTHMLGWSRTSTATSTVGASTSLALAIQFDEAPLGIGAEETLTLTVTASYSYAWGTSTTQNGADTLTISPYSVGWFDYAGFHGRSHGLYTVYIDQILGGNGLFMTGTYKIPAEIEGDLPKPLDPAARAAQPVEGIVGVSRPMTSSEKAFCNSASTNGPVGDQTSAAPIDTVTPSSSAGYIASGTTLRSGWSAQAKLTRLVMQSDGNLVMYRNRDGAAIWSTHTSGHSGAYAVMQTDGNFVVYDAGSQPLWSTHTAGNSGAWANMQDDGNFVIYKGSTALWNSGTTATAK
ncbi:hypothetical protein [Streptomyces sp. 1222.5]|uniref:hypothetical protein n=1 Tax=Streptomyces sp. 1222.5 TaxID=1881026 RepID=UPI003EBBFD33